MIYVIRNIEDFTNMELYDEMIRNGEEKQSKEELGAIIDDYNKNVGIFKKKSKSMLLKAYDMNWNMSEKRLKNELIGSGQIQPNSEKEMDLEQKFGIPFQNRSWFECTIEEMKYSTFSNTNRRDVDHAYVIVEDEYIEIVKESVFLKTNMGHRKVYFQNIASIDYDARGKFHASNGLIINLKSSEHVQLKNVPESWVKYVTDKFEQFLSVGNDNAVNSRENRNDVDNLMKYAELYEKGLLTKEEFDLKKDEIMGTQNVVSPKFCTNCGNSLSPDTKFCPNCGTPIIK